MGKTSKVLVKSGYSLDAQILSDNDHAITSGLENSVDKTELSRVDRAPQAVAKLRIAPNTTFKWNERLTKVTSLASQTAESFRILRSKILLPQDGKSSPKTIMVTSALPREGKSFVTANLGIAFAQGIDQHSLLVDYDLRVPSLARLFGVPAERGLANYLQDNVDLTALLQKTSMDKLSILASGIPPANPAELLGSTRMHNLVEELASRYPDRYVIFDTPPLQVASETQVLAKAVDGVVLVVRQGISSRTLIEKFVSEIGKEKIIGIIFNGHKSNFISDRLVDKGKYYCGNYYNSEKN